MRKSSTVQYTSGGPVTFEMNNKGYSTDERTLRVLRQIVPHAKASNDFSAVMAVMELGQKAGAIRLIQEKVA